MKIGDKTPKYDQARYDELQKELNRLAVQKQQVELDMREIQNELAPMFVQAWQVASARAGKFQRRQESWAEDP